MTGSTVPWGLGFAWVTVYRAARSQRPSGRSRRRRGGDLRVGVEVHVVLAARDRLALARARPAAARQRRGGDLDYFDGDGLAEVTGCPLGSIFLWTDFDSPGALADRVNGSLGPGL